MDIELLKQELIRDEGCRLEAYQDSLGYWTIGVGHLMSHYQDQKISEAEAMDLLSNDIQVCLQDIQNTAWFLACPSDIQKQALLNMRFQLGGEGIRTFKKSLLLIEQHRFKEAGQELRNSIWYRQTPNRAERVIQMIEKG